MSTLSPSQKVGRSRGSSISQALDQVPLNGYSAEGSSQVKPLSGAIKPRKVHVLPEIYLTRGLWNDVKTGRWMLVPSSSFQMMMVPVVMFVNHEMLVQFGIIPRKVMNPFYYMLFPGDPLPNGKFTKQYTDLLFLAYWIIVASFVRQSVMFKLLRPLAHNLGIKGGKIERFTEQGYAIFYWGLMSIFGVVGTLLILAERETDEAVTEHFWLEYPNKEVNLSVKMYYLVQFAYWLHQTILIAARIEKPRKDFKELVVHHIVTLWLIGWSYVVYATYIGVAVFWTMDVSDTFFAFAKCVNYYDQAYSAFPFAVFVGVWTYTRHYLNLVILWSVWYEFELIPAKERRGFIPSEDQWMVGWMQYQVFIPIFLLQLINLFWYFLIWRVLLRAIFSKSLSDERSDDEDEPEEKTEKIE
ncbi:hypothetical protein P7C73_g2164, partial [Tremellales sp. Uapishka_1]